MDKIKKAVAVAGYVVALILGILLYVEKYVDENPVPVAPVEAPAESTLCD